MSNLVAFELQDGEKAMIFLMFPQNLQTTVLLHMVQMLSLNIIICYQIENSMPIKFKTQNTHNYLKSNYKK